MLIKSIRTAIMLLSLVFMIVIAVSVFYLSVTEHRELYARYVEGDLDALTENMASDLVGVINHPNQFFELKAYLLSLDPYDHVIGAAVYDKSWELIDEYVGHARVRDTSMAPVDFIQWQERRTGVWQDGGHLVAVKLIGDPGLVLGYLVVVNDYEGPLEFSTRNLTIRVLPPALLSIVVLMLFFYIMGNRWLSPLTRLSEFARRVQRTKDYSLKIPISGHYEVSSLTSDINNMMDAIRQESEINQEYVGLLEERREEMEYLANYDSLTGLVNRQYFITQLEHVLKNEQGSGVGYAVMFVDLDGFKVVNDSLGHEVGDQLLVEVAQRLKSYVPENDIVSRHGGDEFLILVNDCGQPDCLKELANCIVNGLTQKFLIQSWEVRISASVGIATASENCTDLRELIRNADVAMYNAKSAGKARFSFFTDDMLKDYQRRMDIANAIEYALEHNEFSVHYQAKVTPDGVPVGAEALVRWRSEQLGFVSPAEFIPIAEQSGKITEITQWVINRVCLDVRDAIPRVKRAIPVSINLSASDLKKYHLVGFIKGAFIKYGIPPGLVEFEVTEHSYLDNLDMANRFFAEISAMGCEVALDDFGTGYSSLSYLTKIPIDVIKIDKQFVDNIGASERDDALVLTIVEMGRRLGMELCAEGVETAEQLKFLSDNGCRIIQGYLFSKPLPLPEFLEYLQQVEHKLANEA